MYCYLPVSLCLFESLRRDFNEAKAVNISEYYCNYDSPMTSQVSSNLSFTGTILVLPDRNGKFLPGIKRKQKWYYIKLYFAWRYRSFVDFLKHQSKMMPIFDNLFMSTCVFVY